MEGQLKESAQCVHADGIQINVDLLDLILQAEARGEEVPEEDDPDDPAVGGCADDRDNERQLDPVPRDNEPLSTSSPVDQPAEEGAEQRQGEKHGATRGKERFTRWRKKKRMAEMDPHDERHIKKVALRVLEKMTTIRVDADLGENPGGERKANFAVASTGFMGRMLRAKPEDLKAYTPDELKALKMRLVQWDGM